MLLLADRLKMAQRSQVMTAQPQIAPVHGWNTRDAYDVMDPLDAITLDNWYPDAGGVSVRTGSLSYATGMSGTVKTLAEYNSGATRRFAAAAGGNFYNITNSGAVGAPLASGFSSDVWQTVNFLGRTFFFNGVDTAQVYNGSTFTNSTFTGVSQSTLVGAIIYQQRLFAWASSSTGFWYAPLNSITGAMSFFDLSPFSPNGGNLIAAATYSHDGGNGVLDFIAFMMNSGDCLIYYGNNPGDANNWQLIGIYRISPPVNARAVCNYGAEAFIITADDHVPLGQQLVALQRGELPPRSKVSNAVQAAVKANASSFGWQALYYPRGRRLIFNIPGGGGNTGFAQHVQNTGSTYIDQMTGRPTSPWCRFINLDAQCFGLFNDNLYFGTSSGTVLKLDIGNTDAGAPITAFAQQAWNNFKDPSRKMLTAVRPVVLSTLSPVTYAIEVGFDYGTFTLNTEGTTSSLNNTPWHGIGGTGVSIGTVLNIQASSASTTWLRTDFRFMRGTYL